jgi:hypothetical protein
MTPEDQKELAERLGLCWHDDDWNDQLGRYQCIKCGKFLSDEVVWNPDFSDPRVVLREMMTRKDWFKFQSSLFCPQDRVHDAIIPIYYITEPYKLAKAALEWLREDDK